MNRIYLTLIILLSAMLLLIAVAPSIPRDVLFWVIESLGVLTLGFLLYFYRRVMRPLHVNGHGMELLLIREILTRHQCRFSLKTGVDGMTRFRIEFAG